MKIYFAREYGHPSTGHQMVDTEVDTEALQWFKQALGEGGSAYATLPSGERVVSRDLDEFPQAEFYTVMHPLKGG